MPRFFFEVDANEAVYEDTQGVEYPTDQAALQAGQRLAASLSEAGSEFIGNTLKILNEAEEEIGHFLILPSKDLLQ